MVDGSHQKVAIVTGAARGIGHAVSTRLARDGHKVVLVDRTTDVHDAAATLAATGVDAVAASVDLADRESVSRFVAMATTEYGRCDILVNNAAIIGTGPDGDRYSIRETPMAVWDQVLEVNLTAAVSLSSWALGLMSSRGWGRIINVSSRAARVYSSTVTASYAASKAGLIGFTRTLAGEAGEFGVTANCVAPGMIETVLADEAPNGGALQAAYAKLVPLGRIGTREEVASVISFLASDDASYVTGAVIDINGGVFG